MNVLAQAPVPQQQQQQQASEGARRQYHNNDNHNNNNKRVRECGASATATTIPTTTTTGEWESAEELGDTWKSRNSVAYGRGDAERFGCSYPPTRL